MGAFITMRKKLVVSATLLLAASLPWQANAGTFDFSFAGAGVSGTVELTYGAATDGKYPQAFEVTGISGTFSDSNNGLNIVNAPIGPLEAIKHDTPEPTNLLAPLDFSRFAVTAGLPAQNHGFLTYDNLFYPGGSPPTASDYQVHGGFLDIYGLLFDIGGGGVVDFWSNGDFSGTGTGPIDYGVAVATTDTSLDYVGGGVSITPEPSAFVLLGSGLLGMLVWRRRASRQSSL
jgi:PEP-CTERM motif